MKKFLYLILGFISASILLFSTGLIGSDYAAFAAVRDRLVWDGRDIYYDPAFHIDDENIRSKKITWAGENNCFVYEVFFKDDVLYTAYVDPTGKAIRGFVLPDGKAESSSFWYYINNDGMIHFNWMRLWENLSMVIAIYVLPVVVLILMIL